MDRSSTLVPLNPDLEVRAEGYAPQPLKLTLTQGKTLRQTVKLERQSGALLLGSLTLTSAPGGATVSSSSTVLGKTPLTLKDLPPGPVNYTLALEGYGEVVLRGEVKAGQNTNLQATLERIPAVAPVVPPTPPTPVAPVVPTAPSAPTPPAAPVVKPQLTLLGPVNGSSVTGASLTLKLQLSDYSGPPPLLSYSVNGQSSRSVGVRSSGANGLDLTVDLPSDLKDGQRLELLIRAQDPSFALEPLWINYTYRKPVKRWALVVGNAQYTKIRALANPTNDATDIAALLTKLGFDVTLEQNLGKSQLEKAIDTFGQKLQKEPGVALFYYSGHGLEVNGINYLVPVDAAFKGASEVPYKAVNVGLVLAQMQDSQNPTNLLILDSCRDNPLPDRSTKSLNLSGGFAFLNAPRGTVIAYTTADDGQGRNSPYTTSLLSNLSTSGRSISQVFNRVRADVIRSTGGKQQPWESVSLLDDLFLNP